MTDRLDQARDAEIQRAAAETWGTEPEQYSGAELARYFFGMAIFLAAAGVVSAYVIDALRGIL